MPVNHYDEGDHTQVYVQNDSGEDLTFKWAKNHFPVPAGQRVTMPYNAMKVYLGDPKAVNTDANPQRRLEFYRVRGKFGIGGHNEAELKTQEGRLPESGLPEIHAFTLKGEEIPTPLIDPEGKMVRASAVDASIEAKLAALQSEVAQLRASNADDQSEPFDADVDYDGPPADLLDPEPRAGQPPTDKAKPRKPKAGTVSGGKAQMGSLTS